MSVGHALRTFTSATFFPAVLMGAVAWAMQLQEWGLSDPVVVFGVTFCASLPILALQRVLPYQQAWRGTPKDYQLDLLHLLLSNAAFGSFMRAAAFGFVSMLASEIEARVGHPLWPMAWPIVAQLALAVLSGDRAAALALADRVQEQHAGGSER